MPGEQHEEYADKVYLGIEFIEEHLTEPFTLDQVCRHVAVSKFYFTRILQATLGETVFDYARRRYKRSVAALGDSLHPWNGANATAVCSK